MRNLYATHTYNWGVQQLSYYISFMGALRAVFLLLLLPGERHFRLQCLLYI